MSDQMTFNFSESKLRRKKNVTIFILLVFFIAVFIGVMVFPGGPVISKIVVISPGMGTRDIGNLLKTQDLIRSETLFLVIAKITRVGNKLQAGQYLLNNRMSQREILNKIATGDVNGIKLTVPEGYTVRQIASLIAEKKLGSQKKFLKEAQKQKLEGYLFPATYIIYPGTTEMDIINMMTGEFEKKYQAQFSQRAKELGMSKKEVVILASIIEKEAREDEERAVVSSVFYNRLKKGWFLESCATVQYSMGERKPKLTYQDLKFKSPYNTYLHPGLPPGPICNPGEASLRAALYPAKTDYLFFVSKDNVSHEFSRYYKEHLKKQKKKR
jgi:UPF0755 protein